MAAPPGVQDVLDFLSERGLASVAAALRDDVLAGGGGFDDLHGSRPSLPPVRVTPGGGNGDGDGGGEEPSSSSSGEFFLSMGSSPSELLNPYGIWSPARLKSEDSSDREFGTAREYNDPNIFGDSYWYDDQYGGYLNDPFRAPTNSSGCHSEDKFVMSIEAEERFGKKESGNGDGGLGSRAGIGCACDKSEHGVEVGCEGCTEIFRCSFPLCDCCSGDAVERVGNLSSSSSVYGRYRIMEDETERLDEFELKKVDECPEPVAWKGNSSHDPNLMGKEKSLKLGLLERECQLIDSYAVEGSTLTYYDPASGQKSNGNSNYCIKNFATNSENEELENYNKHLHAEKTFQPDAKDGYEDGGFQDPGAVGVEGEDHTTVDELQIYSSYEEEYEIFDLRIVHRKNRTGFEENKDFSIVLNSVIAGRYYVTEYLGSAAFSKVVQAHDLQTGTDVCLKIIKNDKDFFDQSLDEIKLLKFVNKYDPADECHVLRLYDYFYYQEHLFIVCELLRANLYEFQKYNQESGGEVYFTLSRIQDIARQCLEALEYLHHLRIIHCDLKPENILFKSYSRCEIKIIDLGSSCFQTDNLCLYVQSRSYRAPEVILGLSYDEKIDIWSLGCILAELFTGDVLFPNDSVVMMLARMIGIIGPIDMEMLAMGQETQKYFTDDYDLFHKNEETKQVEYLIPEKSSLASHLQASDAMFIDFLNFLLQKNPKTRPTASQALQHKWLSFSYQ